jgi:hypothetical protein
LQVKDVLEKGKIEFIDLRQIHDGSLLIGWRA